MHGQMRPSVALALAALAGSAGAFTTSVHRRTPGLTIRRGTGRQPFAPAVRKLLAAEGTAPEEAGGVGAIAGAPTGRSIGAESSVALGGVRDDSKFR